MNVKQLKQVKEIIKEHEKDYDFNDYIDNYLEDKELLEINNETDLIEYIELANQDFNITNAEVIYYATAMKYLTEHDTSLQESMEIASEIGFETKNLNSETLASLLKSRNNEEDFATFLNDIESDLEELFNI